MNENKEYDVYNPGFKVKDNILFEQIISDEGLKYALYALNGITILPDIDHIETTIFQNSHYKPEPNVPWMLPREPIECDLETLHSEIHSFIHDRLDLIDEREYRVITSWIIASWRLEDFNTAPYLFFLGPKESGKTRALDLLQSLSYRGKECSSMTEAVLFRATEKYHLTLLLDETEYYAKREDILALLNSRYRRGATVPRNVQVGKKDQGKYKIQWFDVFGFTALAGTHTFRDTLESRCLIFYMEKSFKKLKPFRLFNCPEADNLRSKLLYYRLHNCGKSLPTIDLKDLSSTRLGELLEPLMQVATPAVRTILEEYAHDVASDREQEEQAGDEAQVLHAVLETKNEQIQGRLSTKTITDKLNEGITNPKSQFSTRSIGHVLKRLGFKKRIMPDSKKGISLDEKLLSRLCHRYKIPFVLENDRNVKNVSSNVDNQIQFDVSNVHDLSSNIPPKPALLPRHELPKLFKNAQKRVNQLSDYVG